MTFKSFWVKMHLLYLFAFIIFSLGVLSYIQYIDLNGHLMSDIQADTCLNHLCCVERFYYRKCFLVLIPCQSLFKLEITIALFFYHWWVVSLFQDLIYTDSNSTYPSVSGFFHLNVSEISCTVVFCSFLCWIIFHWRNISEFIYSSSWWTFGLSQFGAIMIKDAVNIHDQS